MKGAAASVLRQCGCAGITIANLRNIGQGQEQVYSPVYLILSNNFYLQKFKTWRTRK